MSKVIYHSPAFTSGGPFLVPVEALSTYAKRDECLLQMQALGGIHAEPTKEFLKLRSKMLAARRKIERNGWHSRTVSNKEMIDTLTAWKTVTV